MGVITVGVEGHRVIGFFAAGDRDADCDLAQLLGVARPAATHPRLIEIAHQGGTVVVAVHAQVRIAASDREPRCDRPALVAGAFRRACLRGIVRHESELIFLLDVEEIAARVRRAREGQTS
jgi:chemotaxis signal transduction protein